jgi:hypothetical protein
MTDQNAKILNDTDVINTRSNILINHYTFTSKEFLERMRDPLSIQRSDRGGYDWIGEGIDCEVLSCHSNVKGWQAGKVRIVLEFIPDQIPEIVETPEEDSDSPLDEIRQMT